MKQGFSLIEVLFAITFLILVGVAMASLNTVAARLTAATELKQVALSLNEQAISFVALEKRTKTNFAASYPDCAAGQTCFVVCPTDTSQPCVLQAQKASIKVGTALLQFTSQVVIRPTGAFGRYLVNATAIWGNGISRQATLARIVE